MHELTVLERPEHLYHLTLRAKVDGNGPTAVLGSAKYTTLDYGDLEGGVLLVCRAQVSFTTSTVTRAILTHAPGGPPEVTSSTEVMLLDSAFILTQPLPFDTAGVRRWTYNPIGIVCISGAGGLSLAVAVPGGEDWTAYIEVDVTARGVPCA